MLKLVCRWRQVWLCLGVLLAIERVAAAQTLAPDASTRPTADADSETDLLKQAREFGARVATLVRAGDLSGAEAMLRQEIEVRRRRSPPGAFPNGEADLATAVFNLSAILRGFGRDKEAREYIVEALTMQRRLYSPQTHPDGHFSLVRSLLALGTVEKQLGDSSAARRCLNESLEMGRRLYPPDKNPAGHEVFIDIYEILSVISSNEGDYRQSVEYLEQALVAFDRHYPADRLSEANVMDRVARILLNLCIRLTMLGEDGRARDYYQRIMRMQDRLFVSDSGGQNLFSKARLLHDLGVVHKMQDNHAESHEFFSRSLELFRRLFPADKFPDGHPDIAMTLVGLGFALDMQGEREKARGYYEQALEMYRRLYPPQRFPQGHLQTAGCLRALAALLNRMSCPDVALPYGEEAVAIYERLFPISKFPAGHPLYASALANLGILLGSQARFDEADKFFERTLEMYRRLYPQDKYPLGQPKIAFVLKLQGQSAFRRGRYAEAERYLRKAVDMLDQLYPVDRFPEGHHDLPEPLRDLGFSYALQGKFDQAVDYLVRGHVQRDHLAAAFYTSASEVEALNYAVSLPRDLDLLCSVWPHLDRPADDLYAFVWRTHGAIQQAVFRRQQLLRGDASPEVRRLYAEYLDTRRNLSRLALSTDESDFKLAVIRQEQLRMLSQRKESQERKLAVSVPKFVRNQTFSQRPHAELVAQLPKETAYVDFLRYLHDDLDPQPSGLPTRRKTSRYLAFVVAHNRDVQLVDLGDARPIDDAVRLWRRAIVSGDPCPAADTLFRLVWMPLESTLPGSTETIYLTPDGSLTAIPWSALPAGEQGGVLLERYALALVPSGQFLLDQLSAPVCSTTKDGTVLAVGDVQYDEKPAVANLPSSTMTRGPAMTEGARLQWPPLPGTKQDLTNVAALAKNRSVVTLTGTDASTTRVMHELTNARWTILATHGFFADSSMRSALKLDERMLEQRAFLQPEERTTVAGRHPLVLSGLVFAGANLLPSRDTSVGSPMDGSILTAEAIAALPLEELDLAVLAACETGLGDVASGEGVFGLERAFHQAGAKNVIASLWRINDQATSALVRLFLHKLWHEGKSPLMALREAQLHLFRHPEQIADLTQSRGPILAKTVREQSAGLRTQRPTTDLRLWAGFMLSGLGQHSIRGSSDSR